MNPARSSGGFSGEHYWPRGWIFGHRQGNWGGDDRSPHIDVAGRI